MSEMRLKYNGEEHVDLTPENTTVYTFLGQTMLGDVLIENSSINHAFVQLNTNDKGQPTGMYLFAEFCEDYPQVVEHAVENQFPMVSNQRRVPECDLRSYMQELDKAAAKFSATIPDEL